MTSYLYQTELWQPKEGDPVRIADMDDTWRLNALNFMERRAASWQMQETIAFLRSPFGCDTDFDLDWEQQDEPPRWVQGLPLYRALAGGLPGGGSELGVLRERARHWSTCPARKSLEMACQCTPAATAPPVPAGLARAAARSVPAPRAAEPQAQSGQPDDPGIDSTTGRPWGVDEDGFDHHEPHGPNDNCDFDSCSYCFGYHCGWFCAEVRNDHEEATTS